MASAGDRTAMLKYKCLAADKWSRYPATQTVDMDCHSLKDLGGATFCGSDVTITAASGEVDISGTVVFNEPPQSLADPVSDSDLVNKAYIDDGTWAQYPATQDVDMSCNRIINTESITFCDNSYIGPGASFDISSNNDVVIQSVGSSNTSKIVLNGATNTIQLSTAPVLVDTMVSSAAQLIPRTYLDTFISNALPAIAGYLPGTCYSQHKNIGRSSITIGTSTTSGFMIFFYPLVDTLISKVITYSTAGTAPSYNTGPAAGISTVGFSLVEFPTYTSLSGTTKATTGNVAALTPYIWNTLSRYSTPLISQYTLKADLKYGLTFYRYGNTTNPTGGVSGFLGFTNGAGLSLYTMGVNTTGSIVDIQSCVSFSNTDVTPNSLIPAVGSTVSFSTTAGPIFGLTLGLE